MVATKFDPNIAQLNRKNSWRHPTLYSPLSSHKMTDEALVSKLLTMVNHGEPGVWRIVLDLEDSVASHQLAAAMLNLQTILDGMDPNSRVSVFVRPRNPEVLTEVLNLPNIHKVSGFVTPKADPDTFPHYADQLWGTGFWLMPVLETQGMFDYEYRLRLRRVLSDSHYSNRIDCVRIGANDLLGHLGLRRSTEDLTVYDQIGGLIEDIVKEFRGITGFNVSAPVFEIFDTEYDDLLRREVRRNRALDLFGQTIIHTRHVRIVRDMYKVAHKDLDSAKQILANHKDSSNGKAVNGLHGRMDEPTTHRRWAMCIMQRYHLFGGNWQSANVL